MAIRIYCLDDHELIVQGLRTDLGSLEEFSIVGSATDPRIGLEEILMNRASIDIVVTDIEMPHITGFQVCESIKSSGPMPRVVYLTYHMNDETRYKATRTKMDGMIYKNATKDELASFLSDVHRGESVVIRNLPEGVQPIRESTALTTAERRVLYLIACEGLTNSEAAERLHRSKDTIETHRKSIMSKLGLKNTVGLVHYALSIGICSSPPPHD